MSTYFDCRDFKVHFVKVSRISATGNVINRNRGVTLVQGQAGC